MIIAARFLAEQLLPSVPSSEERALLHLSEAAALVTHDELAVERQGSQSHRALLTHYANDWLAGMAWTAFTLGGPAAQLALESWTEIIEMVPGAADADRLSRMTLR